MKLGFHEDTENDSKIAELLKSGDEQTNLKEYVDCMKGELNDISSITDESMGCVSSSPSLEKLRTKGHEVLHVVDFSDEMAMQQPKEFDGKGLKSATKDRFDLGDGDDELKAESSLEDCRVAMKVKFETGHREETVEVTRVIPHERILKPAGDRASVRERVRQLERKVGESYSHSVEVTRINPDDRQSEDLEHEAPHKRRMQESDPDPHAPVHFSLCDGWSDEGTKSVDDSAELETRP